MNTLLEQLRSLEAELHHPGVRCSRDRLERLLHANFHEIGRSGRPYTRETVVDFLAALREPPLVEASDYAVTLLADGCALLTYRSARRTAAGLAEHAYRSSVWRRSAEVWQLFYHQGTPAGPWE